MKLVQIVKLAKNKPIVKQAESFATPKGEKIARKGLIL